MKRFFFAAVAGLASFAPLAAQEGTLAPTVPVVPAPVVQNGNLINPAGVGSTRQPFFTMPKWSPLKSPVSTTNTADVPAPPKANPPLTSPAMPPYSKYTQPIPHPTGTVDAPCGLGGCTTGGCTTGRDRSCWAHFKAWLCYAPSKSDLPKCQPTPYHTPLQGMFPCTPSCGYGCGNGNCTGQYPAVMQQPVPTQPMAPPMGQPNPPQKMPAPRPLTTPTVPAPSVPVPMPMPTPTSASPVMMPPRGVSGAPMAPAGEVRSVPVVAPAAPANYAAPAGYRFTNPYSTNWKPAPQPGSVVPVSATAPQK
jgi:hypothetical protein